MQPGALDVYPPTKTGTFTVPLDHYRFVPQPTFKIRYASYDAFAASRAPVLFYAGNEGALELFYNASGALFEHAQALAAHVFFVEHRYYGKSLPFGPNVSFTNENLQWLSVEQALADYASLIANLPNLIGCVGTGARAAAGRCDVVLLGGSYGGMLAAWHRYKFPHLSVGAVASGAPIDFYPSTGPGGVQSVFRDAVVNTFKIYGGAGSDGGNGGGSSDGGGDCGAALLAALAAADSATTTELDAAGVVPCHTWRSDSAERYAFYAKGAVADIALVDYPYPTNFIAPLPANPVKAACLHLISRSDAGAPVAGAPPSGAAAVPHATNRRSAAARAPSGVSALRVSALRALHSAVLGLVNASGDLPCLNLRAELVGQPTRRQPAKDALFAVGEPMHSARLRTFLRRPPPLATDLPPEGVARTSQSVEHSASSSSSSRPSSSSSALGVTAWNYQACAELLLEPLTSDGFGFYPEANSQIRETEELCTRSFGIQPRPAWMATSFGRGADFNLSSNIVFMENDKVCRRATLVWPPCMAALYVRALPHF